VDMLVLRRLSGILCTLPLLVQLADSQSCPNNCNGHGDCFNPNRVCDCYNGWTLGDCSQRLCPMGTAWADYATGVDEAHNPEECSNMGTLPPPKNKTALVPVLSLLSSSLSPPCNLANVPYPRVSTPPPLSRRLR
jgi:hypothetical protein